MSLSMKRGLVAVFFVIFVFCTGSRYLGFYPFGAATRFVSIVSFVLLAAVSFLVGAFDVEQPGSHERERG